MRRSWAIELALLALYLLAGFLGLKLLSGNAYEWMIGDPVWHGAPKRLCELPPDDSPRDLGLAFALLLILFGLALSILYFRRRRSPLFFAATVAVAAFAAWRLYLRDALCF